MTGTTSTPEIYRVRPAAGPIHATALIPGSKSLTNRAVMCAALATGPSRIANLAPGDDSTAMLEILERLGIEATPIAHGDHGESGAMGSAATVVGRGGELRPGPLQLSAGLAGTTSRFVTALCALGPGPYVVDGLSALRGRPMGPLHEALRDLGVSVRGLEKADHLPVEISGPVNPQVQEIAVRGDLSSQYLSALMMIAPMLAEGLTISLTSALVSRPYVELTAAVMTAFGAVRVEITQDQVSIAAGGYQPTDYVVEPDASSASYPLAAVAICGGEIQIPGFGPDLLQGDLRFVALLESMGCEVRWESDSLLMRRDPDRPLNGITVNMADISDLVPTMAVVAAIADSPTEISGVGFIRNKESDRLGDLVHELAVVGVDAVETPDGIVISPSAAKLRAGRVSTHHDHRLAMAFAVLGLVADGLEIEDPSVVSKSWPDFFIEFESWYEPQ
jgi:3-phosphoshikimate 1-carboxyvinyltransferase